MSHIAEVYAKDLGVKIGKPIISDHFFPGLPEKYITFQASNKMPAANYLYWDLVIGLIKPHIGDIKIVQVGGHQDKIIKGVDQSTLNCPYKQMNYIIKKSKAHVGCDSLPGHIASAYDIPSVILHFNLYPENSKPLWNETNDCISLHPDFSNEKPSFGTNCNRINEIKPEQIAQAVLDQLGIEEKIKFKTIRTGSVFQNKTVEIEPNFFVDSKELRGKPINVRGDLHFDLANICKWCKMCIVNLYLEETFNWEFLKEMPNLKQVVFKYSKQHNEIDLSQFFKKLKNNKINIVIQTKDKDILSDARLKYFDYNFVLEEIADISPDIPSGCKFISKKRFASNAQIFPSESSAKRLDKSNNFIYDEISKSEIESLYIYDEKE